MQTTDYDAVIALWGITENMQLREADSRESITDYLDQNPNLSFVATVGGQMVGAVLVGTDGRRGYIQHLAVADKHRGKRIGKGLIEQATTALGLIGIRKTHLFVTAENENAQQFYRSLGWEDRKEIKMYSFNASANLNI
ncbi:GNAT family N-acetyltransferase [Vibrio sp. 10N.286.49.C2]|uniref:GNAT family N-acetyltransferase n=1 Tax=unclassified Vibrio TaxID=2614977 RepID=UPI000C831209|nr:MULTISPECIES: GNAT family N-acetyltransferase [unclassified Vibrio]PMH37252.1 GNAT family N-acetyltransferase [Vibrio sp. 10N.286.49.C2]PMH57397.1 GNAT family N-acetyltransferase [Vibrio sp. 10N.286.49.B1]PMH82156.1 GNAT family N-acetyltransferase [Vibrio sp. 10N.286.48.B7]